MNLNLYKPIIKHNGFSVFTGGEKVSGEIHFSELEKKFPVLKAFFDDDDLQEITITSGNIGFSRTYQKQFCGKEDIT